MFTIQVFSKSSGRPSSGRRVRVGLYGMTEEKLTDSNGEVHFNNKPGRGKVFVDHKVAFDGSVEGRVIIYV